MIKLRQDDGFTLIELVVMLVIVVILTLVSVPLFNTLVQKYRVTNAAEALFNMLQYAKSEAVKRNTNIYVSFSPGDNWCYGINVSSACDCTTTNSCGLGNVSAASAQQLTLSTNSLTSNTIYFEGTHGAANASGSVTFTVYGQSTLITISIARLGSLQLCSTGISGYTAC